MALEDEQALVEAETGGAAERLRSCKALDGVEEAALRGLAAGAVHFSLPAGATLFEDGSASDGVFLLVNGRLGLHPDGEHGQRIEIGPGEIVGELGWLLGEPHGARVVAVRDSELLKFERFALDRTAEGSPRFALAIARLCARRLARMGRRSTPPHRARAFVILPNGPDAGAAEFATRLVTELSALGRAEMLWDVRASSHTSDWFNRVEEANDYVVYLADTDASAWTRQCGRQADVVLLTADARGTPRPWSPAPLAVAAAAHAPCELVLLHGGSFAPGRARDWLACANVERHHHVVDDQDVARVARLLTRRGVGLVLSGGGARGFAHLGAIRALREARVPIDHVGGASIGSIIAAGVAMGWSDEDMRARYHRCFVRTNPVNDYTFPYLALTRGQKVSRLLRGEFGDTLIEDLRVPFFCASSNLATGRTANHASGLLWRALRASVAIPGVMPPVFGENEILVDGAAINNLPIDLMHQRTPGFIIASDAGLDHSLLSRAEAGAAAPAAAHGQRKPRQRRSLNIFQVLMRAGMVGGDSGAAAQRALADVILRPAIDDVDLLNWRAFDRVIEAGYQKTRLAIASLPLLPRLAPPAGARAGHADSLSEEIERRLRARRGAVNTVEPMRS